MQRLVRDATAGGAASAAFAGEECARSGLAHDRFDRIADGPEAQGCATGSKASRSRRCRAFCGMSCCETATRGAIADATHFRRGRPGRRRALGRQWASNRYAAAAANLLSMWRGVGSRSGRPYSVSLKPLANMPSFPSLGSFGVASQRTTGSTRKCMLHGAPRSDRAAVLPHSMSSAALCGAGLGMDKARQ